MTRRSRRLQHLGSWIQKKRGNWSEANDAPQCFIVTCYSRATHTTPEGVGFCLTHYSNWLNNNPPTGTPVKRSFMDTSPDADEFVDDDFDREYLHADFWDDQHEVEEGEWEADLPHGDGWEMYDFSECSTCKKAVAWVYGVDATLPFLARTPEAGNEVWKWGEPHELLCQGQSEDYTHPHVHFRVGDEERLVFLEGRAEA